MKALIVWTLSLILGLEPAFSAAGKSHHEEIKAFLKRSQVATKPVTLGQLYELNRSYLPEDQSEDMKFFFSQYRDVTLPKFDINKVMGPEGQELIQLQAVEKGQAISLTYVMSQEVFVRVNGVNYTWEEVGDIRKLLVKAGASEQQVKEIFPSRKPSSSENGLPAEKILKLNPDQRKIYFKQIRDLMESIEEVENAVGRKGASGQQHLQSPVTQQTWKWFLGIQAWADSECPYRCRPAIYGEGICVPSNRYKFKTCNERVKQRGSDIPQLLKKQDAESLEKARNEALNAAKSLVEEYCEGSLKSSPECIGLTDRLNAINSWNCGNIAFATENPSLCGNSNSQEESTVRCDEPTQLHLSLKVETCPGGTVTIVHDLCADGRVGYKCKCDLGYKFVDKMKCGPADRAESTDRVSTAAMKVGKNILPAVMLAGIVGLAFWAFNSSNKERFKQIQPQPVQPPITAPPIPTVPTLPMPPPPQSGVAPKKKAKAVPKIVPTIPTKKSGSAQ